MVSKLEYLRDLTQQLSAQEEQRAEYGRFLEALPFGVCVINQSTNVKYMNENAKQLFGSNLDVPFQLVKEQIDLAFRGKTSMSGTLRINLQGGGDANAVVWASPVWCEEEGVTHALVAFCTETFLGERSNVK